MTPSPEAGGPEGIARALTRADVPALLQAEPAVATADAQGLPPLLVLLRRATGARAEVGDCARLLLDAGADPDSHTVEWGGEGRMSALFDAVEREDVALVRLLVERGATKDEDAFYHACEYSDNELLDLSTHPDTRAA